MIRTPFGSLPHDLKEALNAALAPVADAALAEFRTWPLMQHVGEPWPDAGKRFVAVKSFVDVVKGLKSGETAALEEAANPGLKAMYHNLSTLLNLRQQHFYQAWGRVQNVIWSETDKALKATSKRLKWKPAKAEEGFWKFTPNTQLWQHVWEQLHPEAIEVPFREHYLTILKAGHFPAGLKGTDWKRCEFLYY